MNKLNKVLLAMVILIFGVTNSFAAENEVTNKINEYLNALNEKETTVLDNLVNDEANFTMINKIIGKNELLSEADYIQIVKEGKVGRWVTSTEVKIVDLQDELAIVSIVSDGKKLVGKEYLTLVLVNGNWEIVNSVSTLSKK